MRVTEYDYAAHPVSSGMGCLMAWRFTHKPLLTCYSVSMRCSIAYTMAQSPWNPIAIGFGRTLDWAGADGGGVLGATP